MFNISKVKFFSQQNCAIQIFIRFYIFSDIRNSFSGQQKWGAHSNPGRCYITEQVKSISSCGKSDFRFETSVTKLVERFFAGGNKST